MKDTLSTKHHLLFWRPLFLDTTSQEVSSRPDTMLHALFPCIVFIAFALSSIAKPLDLGIPRMIISERDLDNTTRSRSGNNTVDDVDDHIVKGCFRQAKPPEPQLQRTSFIDCFNAEQQLAAHNPHEPVHFHRNNDTTFVLPMELKYRTCVILLDMVSLDAEDVFYVAQVRDAVIDTARKCTAQTKALGGLALVGPKKMMEVWVTGRP